MNQTRVIAVRMAWRLRYDLAAVFVALAVDSVIPLPQLFG